MLCKYIGYQNKNSGIHVHKLVDIRNHHYKGKMHCYLTLFIASGNGDLN